MYIFVSRSVFMATDFASSSFFAYSVYLYFSSSFVFGLCSKLRDLFFWNTGSCRSLAMRSVELRLPKSPHATTNSSHPCLSFSYISLPSNRPDRLIIFLLLLKFRRAPSPNRLQLLIPSCVLLCRI